MKMVSIVYASFLCKLFRKGSFEEDFILSEDEVVKIQQDLFLQYIKEYHPMNDVLDCWRDTSHDVWIADSSGHSRPEKWSIRKFHAKR